MPSAISPTHPTSTPAPEPSRRWTRLGLDDGGPGRTHLSYEMLRELGQRCGGRRVSVAMPTHLRGPQTQQDPVRLSGLLRQVEAELAEELGASRAVRLLRPAHELADDASFWKHCDRGLVLLLDTRGLAAFKVPRPLQPVAWVGERFRTTPLLPLVEPDRFRVLAVSQHDVTLLEGDRRGLEPLPQGDLPRALEDVVGHDLERGSLQFHTGGPGGRAVFHGQGEGNDDHDHERIEFLRRVTDVVKRRLGTSTEPLVLAAVERTVADLRRLGAGLPLTPDAVLGNPGDLGLSELHAAAWTCAEPELRRPANELRARIDERLGTPLASIDLREILHAARWGRVDALVVAGDEPQWGTCDTTCEHIELHEAHQRGDFDLVDLTVAHALAYGADVFMAPAGALPEDARVGAVFRF